MRAKLPAVLSVVVSLLGCAHEAEPFRPATAGATRLLQQNPGLTSPERLTGEFTIFDVPVGDLVMELCPKAAAREASMETRIQAAALIRAVRSIGGDARTTFAPDGASPSRTEVLVVDGEKRRSYLIRYHPGAFDFEYRRSSDEEPLRGSQALPEPATIHDLHSALLLLRAWQPHLDEEAHFYVVMGRRLYRVEARSAGRKVLVIEGTPRVTTRIDGEATRIDIDPSDTGQARRTFSLWLEEGRDAVPVRLSATGTYGDVTMTRTRYERSTSLCKK